MRKTIFFTILLSCTLLILYAQETGNSWRESYFAGLPLTIGNKVQFLFDDYIVEDKYGLRRVIGPVEKYTGNPLDFGEDKPWELNLSANWRGVILRHILYDPEEKLYKSWYTIQRWEPGYETGHNYSTLYAESLDGITWKKPELDFFTIDGQKTNIVLHKEKGTNLLQNVILNTRTNDPEQRFIGLAKVVPPGESTRCIVLMYSPDGKKWTLASDPVMFRGASDGGYELVHDHIRDRWLIYRRPPTNALVNGTDDLGFYARRNQKRRFSLALSHDMKNWTYPGNIVLMDEVDDSKITQVGNNMDIDGISIMKYGDIFFGVIGLMDNLAFSLPRHSHLIWSRDGIDWDRLPERPLFIENGQPGDWDAGSIGGMRLISNGDSILIYYGGGNTPQAFYGQEGEKDIPRFSGTGLAFIGRDRFIGLQTGPEGGFLLTRQFILEGNRIEINFSSQVKNPPPVLGSMIKAEILQPAEGHHAAQPYPGFSMKDCDPVIVNDAFNQTITWNGSADLSSLKDKPVYIRFYIRNSTLYTFKIENSH